MKPTREQDSGLGRVHRKMGERHGELLDQVAALTAKLDAVRALVEDWRYKGEFGWGPWQEGYGPDQAGAILDGASAELLQILDAPDAAGVSREATP